MIAWREAQQCCIGYQGTAWAAHCCGVVKDVKHGCSLTCRIISLARGSQRSTTATRLQHASSAAAQDAAAASSRLSSPASHHPAPAVNGLAGRSTAPELHGSAGAVASGAAAELALPPEQSNVDTQGASAETPPEGTVQSAAKHRIRIEGALQASHTLARDWASGRLSLDYPPAEDDDVGSVRSGPMPSQDSMQESSSAAVLHSVLSSLRQVSSCFPCPAVVPNRPRSAAPCRFHTLLHHACLHGQMTTSSMQSITLAPVQMTRDSIASAIAWRRPACHQHCACQLSCKL